MSKGFLPDAQLVFPAGRAVFELLIFEGRMNDWVFRILLVYENQTSPATARRTPQSFRTKNSCRAFCRDESV